MPNVWGGSWGASWGNSWAEAVEAPDEPHIPHPDDPWGGSWADSWNAHWRRTGGAVVETTPVTIAGKPRISRATQYFHKTLTELRREERERLRKLRKLAKAKIEAAAREGETSETLLMALGKRVIEQAAPEAKWLTEPVMDAVAAQYLAAYIAAILLELAQDEDDAEAMLLLAN